MEDINKAGGEGSKGGTVVGHTPSGKAIYKKASHESHKTFTPEDHKAAANLHEDVYNRAMKKLGDKRAEDPNFKPDQKVYDFIQHHHRQMASHTGGGQKPRNVSESSKGAKAPEKKEKDPGANPNKSEKKQFKSQLDNKVIVDTVNRLRGEGKTAEARRIYDKHINKAFDLLEALGKGGPGSGRKGHTTNHDERNKIVSDAIENSPAANMYPLDSFMTDALDKEGGLDYMLNNEEEFKQKMADEYTRNVRSGQDTFVKEAVTYSLASVKAKLGLKKGGAGSGKRGHQSEGLSDQDLHSRREKFAHPQYAKFRHHSGEGLNDADRFKHGMVQDAKKFGYVKKSEELEKGKALPIGTNRTWGSRDYIKHADGWVATSGPHRGKLHEGKNLTTKHDHPNASFLMLLQQKKNITNCKANKVRLLLLWVLEIKNILAK